jgi:hypothetical protein
VPVEDITLPVVPERGARFFRLRAPTADDRALLRASRSFGLSGREQAGGIFRDARLLRYSEQQHTVVLHRASGGLRYYDVQRWQRDDGEAHVELTDRQATAAAERFVTRRKLARRDQYQVLRVTRLHVASGEIEGEKVDERVIDVGVAFQRVVDGIPVDGPGGKLVVYLDAKRNVTGTERLWRPLGAPGPMSELQPPERVLNRIRRRFATEDSMIEWEAFRFGYFELGWDERQAILQPAYIAIFTLTGQERPFRIRKVEVVPALAKPAPGLRVPRKRPVRQPSRRD